MSRMTDFKKWRQHADANGFITNVQRNGKFYEGIVNGAIVCAFKTRTSVYRRFRKIFSTREVQ